MGPPEPLHHSASDVTGARGEAGDVGGQPRSRRIEPAFILFNAQAEAIGFNGERDADFFCSRVFGNVVESLLEGKKYVVAKLRRKWQRENLE